MVFAGVLLLLVGAWQVFIGYAIAGGDEFVFTGGGYWYRADNTGWGWINLAVGVAGIALGLALVGATKRLRRLRAKATLALFVAVVSAMNQFFLAPEYPLWSMLVIAADVFVIWAVTTQTGAADEPETNDGIVRLHPV